MIIDKGYRLVALFDTINRHARFGAWCVTF
jgi:hypothetical protein